MALVRMRRAVQTGSVRMDGLRWAIAVALAASAPSCGGEVLSPPGHSSPVPKAEAGTAEMPAPGAESQGQDGGSENLVTSTPPPSPNEGSSEDASPSPPVGASTGVAEPIVVGSGSSCPATTAPIVVGTKVTVSTTWPATAAVAQGSGPFFLWLLSTYNIDPGNRVSGTNTTCGMQMPMVTFSALGDMAEGVPAGQTGLQQLVFPATSWKGVPPVNITGITGGWNVGSSVEIDPVVTLYGLKSTSALADGSLPWVPSMSAIAVSDLTYADGTPYQPGAGLAGILGTFKNTPPYYAWTTSLAMNSPRADQVSMVLRTQLQLYGTSTGCTAQSGQALMDDLNVRVVGCQLGADGGDALCTTDQAGFIDSNVTQFKPGTGTFTSRVLASGASCADVLSALP